VEIENAHREYDELSKQNQVDVHKAEMREKELLHVLSVREHEIEGLWTDLAPPRPGR
jgi:broad-specificity NMP kinase